MARYPTSISMSRWRISRQCRAEQDRCAHFQSCLDQAGHPAHAQNLVSVAEKYVNPSIAEKSAISEESSRADATTDEAAPAAKAETAPAQSEEDRAEAERKASMLRSRGEKLLAAFK
jgi:hypothetical protein